MDETQVVVVNQIPEIPPGGSLTDLPGIRIGHFTDSRRPTGCTVLLFDAGAVAGVDVRGGAPGTRETDLLAPTHTMTHIHALCLSGGSAFGLDAATGVVRYLEAHNIGFDVGVVRVPIVPAAVIFDLLVGDPKIRPDAESGYLACQSACAPNTIEGSVGVGAGATVGKMMGPQWAMKAGIGMASRKAGEGICVAALAAVNAFGDIRDPRTGQTLAGARAASGNGFADPLALLRDGRFVSPFPIRSGMNTTLGVVATNVAFTKTELTKIAQMAQDGLARTIYPVHTPFDGDTVFAVAVPEPGKDLPVDVGRVGMVAAEVLADAVLRAVWMATGIPGLPGASQWHAQMGGQGTD